MQPSEPCDEPIQRPDPCAMVLFGATGDLTRRKLIPALYSLHVQNLLPDHFTIVAFARREKDDATFREDLRNAVREFAPNLPGEGDSWNRFAEGVIYHRSTFD